MRLGPQGERSIETRTLLGVKSVGDRHTSGLISILGPTYDIYRYNHWRRRGGRVLPG